MVLFQIVNCLNGCIVRNNDININKRREKNNYFKNNIGHCICYLDYLITHNYYGYTYYTILVTIVHYL